MNYKYKLYGAILGDLAGQPYEYKYKGDFSEFNIHDERSCISDDSILTLATASVLLGNFKTFNDAYRYFGQKYINLDSFGKGFQQWLSTPKETIGNSYGNGSIMRISPLMYAPFTLVNIFESIRCSHHHEKSYKAGIMLYEAYQGIEDEKNPHFVQQGVFEIEADKTASICLALLRQDLSTQETIEAAVKLGGDTDTNASISGELTNYHYKDITKEDADYVESKLDSYLLNLLKRFNKQF